MNKQRVQTKNNRASGFTIIEVVLVLAIAGLIFLMVFLALPALQRSQRDTQRKDDLSRINTQITNYQSSNRSKIPTTASGSGGIVGSGGFVQNYLKGTGSVASASEYADPSTGTGYTFTTSTTNPTQGQVNYQTGRICGTDGSAVASDSGVTATSRNYVLRINLESQTTPYCIDNR